MNDNEWIPAVEQAYMAWREDSWDSLSHVLIPIPSSQNLEKEIIKKDAFEKLSQEAKMIVNHIYFAPDEVLKMLTTPQRNRITKGSLNIYLREIGYPIKTVTKVFRELTEFVKTF